MMSYQICLKDPRIESRLEPPQRQGFRLEMETVGARMDRKSSHYQEDENN